MKISARDYARLRNKLFWEIILPSLNAIGFERQPMGKPYWGYQPSFGYLYELWRLPEVSILELLFVRISRPGTGFRLVYNRFKLDYPASSLAELSDIDPMPFLIPPASKSEMSIPPPRWLGELHWPAPYDISGWRWRLGIGIENAIEAEAQRLARDLVRFHDLYGRHWQQKHTPVLVDRSGNVRVAEPS